MIKHYSDKELSEALTRMTVICDTREQSNEHITSYLTSKKIAQSRRTLKTGDYSAMLDDLTLENRIVIERKGSLSELAGNMSADRQRFEDEMTRAKANGIKVFLLVEGACIHDIFTHNYRSELLPKALFASLMSWQAKYDLSMLFCESVDAPVLIHSTLLYWLRAELMGEAAGRIF